jgi:hypothetical protein
MFNYSEEAMSADKKSGNQSLLSWALIFTLSICVVYALFSLASNLAQFALVDKILFGSLGIAVWAIAVFLLLAQLGYNLELNLVDGYYEPALAIGMLVTITVLAVSVVLVILGFVGTIAIAPLGIALLSLSVFFSTEFFKMDRVPFSFRLIVTTLIIGLIIGALGFLA